MERKAGIGFDCIWSKVKVTVTKLRKTFPLNNFSSI